MSVNIPVLQDAHYLVTSGPSLMSLVCSLADQHERGQGRKHVRFRVCANLGDMKFDDAEVSKDLVIISLCRRDPCDGAGIEWMLWALDGGQKLIVHYNAYNRVGSMLIVKKFDEFPKVVFDLKLV